mgnify:CR=1 FL=1
MARFDSVRMLLEAAVAEHVTPAAVIEVGRASQPVWREAVGRLTYEADAPAASADTIFDLASLTKVLATATLLMTQVERGRVALDDEVVQHLLGCTLPRGPVTVEDLLAHCSGLPAHRPFYRTLRGRVDFEAAICATPLEYAPRTQSVYSDLGFMLLGFLLEDITPLPEAFAALWTAIGAGEDLQFHPPEQWTRRIAPTEADPWRGRVLRGEVHDENAWALGGAAGHAGLFGTAAAVGVFARHLLQILDGRVGFARRETLAAFVTRHGGVPGSSRALGWDTMLPTSSCGRLMSPRAFGHTGFTGTSLWIDPDAGTYVVLLTNRVHPLRAGEGITRLRPAVHDAVVAALTG